MNPIQWALLLVDSEHPFLHYCLAHWFCFSKSAKSCSIQTFHKYNILSFFFRVLKMTLGLETFICFFWWFFLEKLPCPWTRLAIVCDLNSLASISMLFLNLNWQYQFIYTKSFSRVLENNLISIPWWWEFIYKSGNL